jgi:hypothetical protein
MTEHLIAGLLYIILSISLLAIVLIMIGGVFPF